LFFPSCFIGFSQAILKNWLIAKNCGVERKFGENKVKIRTQRMVDWKKIKIKKDIIQFKVLNQLNFKSITKSIIDDKILCSI